MSFNFNHKTKSISRCVSVVALLLLLVPQAVAQTDDATDESVITLSDISSASEDEVIEMLESAMKAETGFDTEKIEVPIIPENKTPLTVFDIKNPVSYRVPINKIEPRDTQSPEPAESSIPTPYKYIATATDLFDSVQRAKKYTILSSEEKPSPWVNDSRVGRKIDGIYEVSFSVGPYYDSQECKTEMFLLLQDKIDVIARTVFEIDPIRQIRPSSEQLAGMIVKCEEQKGQFSPDPTCRLHVLLQIDESTIIALKEDAVTEVRNQRMAGVLGSIGVLFILLCLVKLGLSFRRSS